MPLSTRHHEQYAGARGGQLILQRDAGGRWRLNEHASLARALGRAVWVEGARSGFEVLHPIQLSSC